MALKRMTLDLDKEQHEFLKMISTETGISASVLFRVMVQQLETEKDLQSRVINEIYSE